MTAETSVLFDAPGPKARVRHRIIAVIGSIGILALLYLLVRALAAKGQFTGEKWAPFLDSVTWTSYLLPGLQATLVAAFFSISSRSSAESCWAWAVCLSCGQCGWPVAPSWSSSARFRC